MTDDNYGAALLAMAAREAPGYLYAAKLLTGSSAKQALDEILRPPTKRDTAIAYLRERKLYCLDSPVGRIPPQARPMTLLDKWMKERHK